MKICFDIVAVTYGSHFRDMHLLSEGAALREAVSLCTRLRGCHRTGRDRKKQQAEGEGKI